VEVTMPLSHLNGWRAVDAVLNSGSITSAASNLGVSNAAVAQQIRGLEDRIGCSLFARTPGGLVPLPAVEGVRSRLARAFSDLASVQETLSGDRDGRVSISTTQTFAETWIPHHLGDLFAALGTLDLRIDASWRVIDLETSDADFAIRYMDAPGPGLEAVTLFPSGVVPVATPEFVRRYGLDQGAIDLSKIPLIHLNVETTDPDWADWEIWSRRHGMPLPEAPEAQRFELEGSGVRLARSGIGLVLGGLSECLHAVASGDLVMPFGPGSVLAGRYRHRIVWSERRGLSQRARDVAHWIEKRARVDRALMANVFGTG
jgi:DNA-binding transcriptional LysR family regulator